MQNNNNQNPDIFMYTQKLKKNSSENPLPILAILFFLCQAIILVVRYVHVRVWYGPTCPHSNPKIAVKVFVFQKV